MSKVFGSIAFPLVVIALVLVTAFTHWLDGPLSAISAVLPFALLAAFWIYIAVTVRRKKQTPPKADGDDLARRMGLGG